MGLGNFGFMEIMLIFLVVLLLFGAKRLPEIGGSLGKGIREFKSSVREIEKEITTDEPARRSIAKTPVDQPKAEPGASEPVSQPRRLTTSDNNG